MNRNLATLSAALVLPIHPAPPPGSAGPEGVPIPKAPPLEAAASPKLGKSVDGIKCESHEQVLFDIHAHLTIFVNGKARQVPYGIGIGSPFVAQPTQNGRFVTSGDCFSWLHTHAADGIIHIESPITRTFTLGDFFDVWQQPLGPNRVGPARGHVTAFFDGRSYKGDPQDPAREARADPARRRHAADRAGEDQLQLPDGALKPAGACHSSVTVRRPGRRTVTGV